MSSMKLSPVELQALKDANPLDAIVESHGIKLGRINGRGIREAACPCSPKRGKTPFWVNTHKNTYGCLKGGCGGDVFTFLSDYEGLGFKDAVERLGGKEFSFNPDGLAEMQKKREQAARHREELDHHRREKDRLKAYELYKSGSEIWGTDAQVYLAGRRLHVSGLNNLNLRYLPDVPYYHPVNGRYEVIYHGPAMLAPIQGADDRFMGVHITWIDPDHPGKKAGIIAPDGSPCPSKKIKGQSKGGAIRLINGVPGTSLVIGEGIETTLSVFLSLQLYGVSGPYAAWSGISLGNLSGSGLCPATRHPDGRRWIPSDIPDPAAPGMMPPQWAGRIILLGDGDSDPLITAARMRCCERRFKDAGFNASIYFAPPGKDFNEVVMANE